MEGLINDMMDQTKIDNGAFKLDEQYFDLPLVVFKALNISKAIAIHDNIQLVALVEKEEHLNLLSNIMGDEQRYLQTINNFLSNSLKFTDKKGTVRVLIKVKENRVVGKNYGNRVSVLMPEPLKVGEERDLNIEISVIDTGPGISEEGLEGLFMDFGKLEENAQ